MALNKLVPFVVSLTICASIWAQPAARSFDNVADMCAAKDLAKDAPITVKGYRQAGDGGGGTFRYDPKSEADADGGAVLALKEGPGRLWRVVDPDDAAYAEWFGAYGDGDGAAPHDDQAAINACLAAYGRVTLLPKVYGVRGKPATYDPDITYHAVDLGPYYRLFGSGREQTTIKLLDGTNPHGNGPGNNYFGVLANRSFYESAEHVVVRDLTIDCNFDKQNKESTINAIGIRGGGALVERVNFRGYGTGWHPQGRSRECFVIHQSLVYKDATSCRRTGTFRDLDFTDCGHNGMLAGRVGEITHLALGGANNFDNLSWILVKGGDPDWDPANGGENENNWWPGYGGLIENCVFHDEVYEPATQKSPLHGITYGDTVGVVIRGNVARDFEGLGVFTMSWWNRNAIIVSNKFERVTGGIALNMESDGKNPVQHPLHENVLIADNEIELGAHKYAPWGTCGITLYGGDMPVTTRMKSIHIRDNVITGRAFTNAKGDKSVPMGIKLQILRPVYHDIRIEDNIIDVPDYNATAWVPQEPYSLSMFFYPLAHWEEAAKQGHVVYRGNRNKAGKLLYPIIADWYFKNAPVYGKPQ